jgi:hypothetical protein
MKKLLGTVLATALVFPVGSANAAELFKNLKVSGQLDVQGNSARNVTDFATNANPAPVAATNNDRISAVVTRVLMTADWDLLDDVHAQATLRKNDRAWGSIGGAGQGAAGGQSLGGVPGNASLLGSIFVDRANISIDKMMGWADVTVGRQWWGNPGDLIAYWGPKNVYGLNSTMIDALSLAAENDWMKLNGIAGKTAGTAALGAGQSDTDVVGVDVMWKGLPMKAHTFIWNAKTHGAGALGVAPGNTGAAATGLNDNLYVYGVKLRGEAAGGWLNVDIAANAGTNRTTFATQACPAASNAACAAASRNYTGRAVLVDAGWNADLANVGGITPWINLAYGSGNQNTFEKSDSGFRSVSSDYRPGILYGRFNTAGAATLGSAFASGAAVAASGMTGAQDNAMGLTNQAGLNNRTIWGIGTNFTPAAMDQLTLGASVWDFRMSNSVTTHLADKNTAAATVALGNKHIGTEVDVTANWRHSENVSMGVSAATFQPGGLYKEIRRAQQTALGTNGGVGVNPAYGLFWDLSVRW